MNVRELIHSKISIHSRYQATSLRDTSGLPNIPPMLTTADWELAVDVLRSQSRCQEECETAVRKLRSEYPDGPYTLQSCTEVIRAGERYVRLNTAAALLQRNYSLEGVKHFQAEQDVSSN
jgi:hypothetical protein